MSLIFDAKSTVVGLRLRFEADTARFRIEATVEAHFSGRKLYEEHFEYFATWAEVVAWLGTVLSEADATRTVADYLTFGEG